MTAPIVDREARVRAACRFDRNLVVVAGAGTGKTGLLVERLLNLTLSERVPPESLVALTFTEKAAAEMKERVRTGLDALAETPDTLQEGEAARSRDWLVKTAGIPEAEIARRAAAVRERLDRAFIGTIHGFSSDLLRRHPMEAGIPPEMTIDEGATHDLLFEQEWPDYLADELGPAPRDHDLWREVLARFTESEIEDVARSLARCPEACDLLAREGYVGLDAQQMFGEEARRLLDLLAGYREHMNEGSSRERMADMVDTQLLLLPAFLEGGPEALRAARDLPLEDYWDRKGVLTPKMKDGFEEEKEEIQACSQEALKLLSKLRQLHDHAFPSLMKALRPFAQRFRRRVHQDGLLSFTDLLLLTRNLLARSPAVREQESRRVRAILVDEFQDTDPLQYEIVFLLAAAADGAIEDAYAVPLEPGRLFIVGDPKQSIYRFRGADMAAYHRATRHVLQDGGEESLTVNFRSRPRILDPLNRLFENWIGNPPTPGVEPNYEPIHPFREAGDGPAVEVWSVLTPPKATAGDGRREEAKRLAAWIRASAGPERPLAWGDIALLFRAMSDMPIYARAFREAGIPFVVDGGRAFAERPEIVEAFALLRAIANPADPVATLGVLRSTLGAVPDPRLLEFQRAGGAFRWNRNPERQPAGFPEIAAVMERLRGMDRERRSLPLDRWIQKILTESEFTLLMTAYFEGAQRVANVRKLAGRAASLARSRGLTLEETLDALEDEFSGARAEGDSPLADEVTDAVRVLTIHKAKGLEYKVVLLPDLARGNAPDRPETLVSLFWTAFGPRISVELKGRTRMLNSAALLVHFEKRAHQDAEIKRLLYVATTRAKDRLVLVNSSRKGSQLWLKAMEYYWDYHRDAKAETPYPPDGAELIPGVLHRVLSGTEEVGPGGAVPADPSSWFKAFRDAATQAGRERAARFRSPSDDHRARRTEDAGDGGPRDRSAARAVGIAVHGLLERCRFPAPPSASDVEQAASAAARELGIEVEAVQREVASVLDGFFASNLPGYLASVEILGREIPVLYRDAAGVTVHGYADLVYRKDGRIHVADYKTDERTDAGHAAAYREQLADYGEAVRLGLGLSEPPVAEVLFVRDGARVPFDPAETAP